MGKKRLKIAFINIYQGKVNRGGETFVSELSMRLAKNHSVDVIGGRANSNKRWFLVWRFFLDPNGLLILWFSLRNVRNLWRKKYDIVVPMNGGFQVWLVRVATLLYGGKTVVVGQSGIGWDDRHNAWAMPESFVAVSSKALEWVVKANPFLKKAVYIPNGVDLAKFNRKGRKFKTELTGKIVVCVGALVPQKRIELVIRAVAELQDVSLLVVGDGEQKDELERLGKRLLGERYEQISVGHDEMPEIYRAGDVFCLTPERSEAFGIVFVEAMATNLPVVTIKDEQRQEIVGDAGVLVRDPRNSGKLAKAINKALKKKWGSEPRRQAEKFGWERIAGEYEKLFLEICK